MSGSDSAAPSEHDPRPRRTSPSTGHALESPAPARTDEVRGALERARKAQADWRERSFDDRARRIERVVKSLFAARGELAATIARETGKPEPEALVGEVLPALDALQHWSRRAKHVLAERRLTPHLFRTRRLRVSQLPLGAVAVLASWSHPLLLTLAPAAQALAAGNAVLVKPSAWTPETALLVAASFGEAGFPEALFQVLVGGPEVGAALVEARPDAVVFSGGAASGREVAEACARQLTRCTLQLARRAPAIVCADADLELAAAGLVWSSFAHAGQGFLATGRVYVVESVADELARRICEQTAALRQGPDGEADVGAVVTPAQLERLEGLVADAVAGGARVLAGGRRNPDWPGRYFEPTVLADVAPDAGILDDDALGPLLPMVRVADEEQALALANARPLGAGAAIWGRDRRQTLALAQRLGSGSVSVNDALPIWSACEAPFGGGSEAGLGRWNGVAGLEGFCRQQVVMVDRLGGRLRTLGFPYTARKVRALERRMRLRFGTPFGRVLS